MCIERPYDPSTLKQSLIRLDMTGRETVEVFIFFQCHCSNGAFGLCSLFVHAQGTNSTQNPLEGVNVQYTYPGGM